MAEFTEDLNNIRSVSFETEESIADIDIYVSYLIEDYEANLWKYHIQQLNLVLKCKMRVY